MEAERTARLDCLEVVADEELHARIGEVFGAWHLRSERVDELTALRRVGQGHCRVVVTERRPGLRLYLERLRAAGAVPVVLGLPGPDITAEIECVARPSELIASVFRAQGRLLGIETGSAARISQFAQIIAEQFALPELVRVAMAKTRELCEAEGASLLLIEPSTGGLYIDTVEGGADGLERIQLPRGKGVAGKVAVEGRPRLVEDAQSCPYFDRSADRTSGFTTGSIVAAPLVLGGDVLGVLMAVRSTAAAPFSPVHLERLVQLTPHVAIAVHNAQMTNALRTSQSQVLEANQDLEKKVKERTQQISRAKQEWERTFDAIDAPIAVQDGYVIRRTNQAYARRVGRPVREIPGKKCHEVFANRDSPCPGCPLVKGRGQALGAEIETPNATEGRSSFYRFHGYWLSDDPRDGSVVVTYHDITRSHVLAEKLRESERLAAVGQLASGAAHEINNPLGFVTSNLRTLRGLFDELRAPLRTFSDVMLMAKEHRQDEVLELLSNAPEPDTQHIDDGLEMIDESLDGARRVGDIVKGLRELSRLEIGKREPANVNASVSRMVRAELGEAPPNVTLLLDARFMADIPPLQLDQALGHLLRNAKLATPKKEKITVRTWQVNELVMVQVQDEGLGIVHENLRRVFEPFFTTRGVGKGIGLGLTAAYGIVKRVGGDIEAQSDGPGKGSTFTIRLPLAEQQSLAEVA
ncbi:MAG: ATP-binding protein [Archangium sp.]|nr:ATP-binding protein [Archangium sp.]